MRREQTIKTRRWRTPQGEQRLVGYTFLLPDLVGLGVFVAVPIIGAFYVSLHQWAGIGQRKFVGLANYRELIHDQAFLHSLRVTAVYTFTFVPLLFVLSLALALLIHQKLFANGFFRSMYFMPFMLSLVVASVIWSFILDERAGILNTILGKIGIAPQPWLGSIRLAPWSIVIVTLWQSVGYSMIIFLAGLQDIPRDFYEAARVDGAGAVTRFRTITLPLLKPTSVFVLVISLIGAFQLFDPIFVITQGGPANATTTAVYYIYQNAFQYLRLGYASALAIVLFGIIFLFTLLQLRLFRHEPHY
jgi:multiple sugar transport system permease protein